MIDIYYYQRMSINILTLQNEEMRELYLSRNLSLKANELKRKDEEALIQHNKFQKIWKNLQEKFVDNWTEFDKFTKRTSTTFKNHVARKLKFLQRKLVKDGNKLHEARVEFIK